MSGSLGCEIYKAIAFNILLLLYIYTKPTSAAKIKHVLTKVKLE